MKKVLIAIAALTMFVACTKKEQPAAPTNEAPVQQEQAAAPTEPAAAASPEAPAAQ